MFGDQTLDVRPYLRHFTLHRDSPVLDDFLQRSFDAIREEIHQSPSHVRARLPRLTCIEDIIFRAHDDNSCLALDMACTCLYQLGVFIWYLCQFCCIDDPH